VTLTFLFKILTHRGRGDEIRRIEEIVARERQGVPQHQPRHPPK